VRFLHNFYCMLLCMIVVSTLQEEQCHMSNFPYWAISLIKVGYLSQDCVSLMPQLKSPLVPKSQQSKGSPVTVSSPVGNRRLSLYESAACRQLMTERFDDVCKDVLNQRNSRSSHVHHTLLEILPRLAAFNKEKFIKV
jgi:hypothetical protein